MFHYFFEEYKNIYNKKPENRKFSDMPKAERASLIILVLSMFAFLVTYVIWMLTEITWVSWISMVTIVTVIAVSVITVKIMNRRWKIENLDNLNRYKANRLKELKDLLESKYFPGFSNKKYMAWLIESCDKALGEDNGISTLAKALSKFFNVLVFPILTFCSGLLVKSMSDTDAIIMALFVLGILFCCFVLWCVASPAFESLLNKDRPILKTLKEELEFLMLPQDEIQEE